MCTAGEPISFAEVLATNPDWADQNADQSLEAGPPGAARPLDSARNPGGGAEPAGQAVQPSLLDEALKLTGCGLVLANLLRVLSMT